MSIAKQTKELNADQRQALIEFATKHGTRWKSELSDLWMRAAAGPLLQQVRNQFGPAWLRSVTVKQIAGVQ